jgi:hypothetical protein
MNELSGGMNFAFETAAVISKQFFFPNSIFRYFIEVGLRPDKKNESILQEANGMYNGTQLTFNHW